MRLTRGSPDVSRDQRRFRDALGLFPTGVAIVTTVANGERLGMTISSFGSLSLEPPLVLFSMHRKANGYPAWQQATHYAINVLNEDQQELSNRFARARGEKWIGVSTVPGKTGVPLLPNAVATFECVAHSRCDGGDHEIFLGRVIDFTENLAKRGRPLVFFGGQYRKLEDAGQASPSEADLLHGW
ncbi:MAG: flavin reductase family protein [Rhodospirillales bacterium]|nr:flavin reductase family protein [Rhodospirillales bacterium]